MPSLMDNSGAALRVGIVGAGMAGLSCAQALVGQGHAVTLLDKGRGPGGRMSTRRMATPLGEVSFDHGAQYFTARDPAFCHQVAAWAADGVVAPWPLPAPDAWVGTPGMNAVIKAMAQGHQVHWTNAVERVERQGQGWILQAGTQSFGPFDAVVLAVPVEQALPFLSLHDFTMAREAMLTRSQPCWTGMYSFAEALPVAQDMLRDSGFLGWAARSNAKPGRHGPEGWVVQANPEWSAAHIEHAASDIAALLLAELAAALNHDLPAPVTASAHRWRYAMTAGLGLGALWNSDLGLGVCGDWLLGPRIECAWLSGQDLAQRIAAAPPQPVRHLRSAHG